MLVACDVTIITVVTESLNVLQWLFYLFDLFVSIYSRPVEMLLLKCLSTSTLHLLITFTYIHNKISGLFWRHFTQSIILFPFGYLIWLLKQLVCLSNTKLKHKLVNGTTLVTNMWPVGPLFQIKVNLTKRALTGTLLPK